MDTYDKFIVGCNYWPSNAGVSMWQRWDADAVCQDFKVLAEHGIRVLRVFPLWSDFQPLEAYFQVCGETREMRFSDCALPDTDDGRAGLDPLMLDRFSQLVDMAEAYGMRLIVPLVTGWMSGRLFVPAALSNLNHITDSRSVQWQVRMVRRFVQRFKNEPAILAWELGNEFNCMEAVQAPVDAWRWVQSIADAIRASDNTRPVLSGMWPRLDPSDPWKPEDLGELTDVVTSHAYPVWVTSVEGHRLGDTRQQLHATVAAVFQSDVSRRPCLAEEIGTLGPMNGDDQKQAEHARINLWSLWAHNVLGCLWWSSFDFTGVEGPPYDCHATEPELGLFAADRAPKPVAREMAEFQQMLERLPRKIAELPPRRREAVCILSPDQDQWGAGLISFLLAKYAGFDLQFASWSRPLPDADLYLIPCLAGTRCLPQQRWSELKARMEEGASVYLSLEDGAVVGFADIFGCRVVSRERRAEPAVLHGETLTEVALPCSTKATRYEITSERAEVLATDADGSPMFTVADYGRGRAFCLFHPMETGLAHDYGMQPAGTIGACSRIYRMLARAVIDQRLLRKRDACEPLITTEHPTGDGSVAAVLINLGQESLETAIDLHPSVRSAEILVGDGEIVQGQLGIRLSPCSGMVVMIRSAYHDTSGNTSASDAAAGLD